MISRRLLFIFSVAFFSTSGSFIYSGERARGNGLPRECMAGRSLDGLYQDLRAQSIHRDNQYRELMRSRERLASKEKDYRRLDDHDSLKDCEKAKDRVIRAREKVVYNEAQIEKIDKEMLTFYTCIGQRNYDAFSNK